jgi:hypothetical protein
LTRAGFAVDLVSIKDSLKHGKPIQNDVFAQDNDVLVKAASDQARKPYSCFTRPIRGRLMRIVLNQRRNEFARQALKSAECLEEMRQKATSCFSAVGAIRI